MSTYTEAQVNDLIVTLSRTLAAFYGQAIEAAGLEIDDLDDDSPDEAVAQKTAAAFESATKKALDLVDLFGALPQLSGNPFWQPAIGRARDSFEHLLTDLQDDETTSLEKLQRVVDGIEIISDVPVPTTGVAVGDTTVGKLFGYAGHALTAIDIVAAMRTRNYSKIVSGFTMIGAGAVIQGAVEAGVAALGLASWPFLVAGAAVAWAAKEFYEDKFDEFYQSMLGNEEVAFVVEKYARQYGGPFLHFDSVNSVGQLGTANNDVKVGLAGLTNIIGGGGGDDWLSGAELTDVLGGGSGADRLEGLDGDDQLIGGDGNDLLAGGRGNDRLEGGEGSDQYKFQTDDFAGGPSEDVIVDSDGQGKILLNDLDIAGHGLIADTIFADGSGIWRTQDQQFSLWVAGEPGDQTLYIRQRATGSRILVQGWHNGDLGITLEGGGEPAGTPNAGVVDALFDQAGDEDPALRTSTDDDVAGTGSNDAIDGGLGDDRIDGDGGDDLLLGGAGDNTVLGGDGNDFIFGSNLTLKLERNTNTSDYQAWYDANVAGKDYIAASGNGWYVRTGDMSAYDPGQANGGNYLFQLYTAPGTDTSSIGSPSPDEFASGVDSVDAGAGNDFVSASEGDDIVDGGAGNDVLMGGANDDFVRGGEGNDFIRGDYTAIQGSDVSASASPDGDDVLYGEAGEDVIAGEGGNDVVDGGADNDRLYGDGGNDRVLGGDGDDYLEGDRQASVDPGQALELNGADYLDGGAGNDLMHGGGGDDTLLGGSGDDQIDGDYDGGDRALDGNDLIQAGDGNDLALGSGGDDTIYGEAGDDRIYGDSSGIPESQHGNDILYGDAGTDTLWGQGGDDRLYGGGDDDRLQGGTGNDALYGDEGLDTLYGGEGNDLLLGGAGNDGMTGDAGDDRLLGGIGNDLLLGGKGDDQLSGEDGNDQLQGGEGADRVEGGSGNDVLYGDAGDDELLGGEGNDKLLGDAGNDVLTGAAGSDLLMGGQGNDRYRFDAGFGTDQVVEFAAEAGELDTIELNGLGSLDDASWTRAGDDLQIAVAGTADVLVVGGFFTGNRYEVALADGTRFSVAQIAAISRVTVVEPPSAPPQTTRTINGTSGNDTLRGTPDSDDIRGGAGDDVVYGDDSGSNYPYEGSADIIDGGTGNDVLYGGQGNDVYVFERGFGHDTVYFGGGGYAGDSTIAFQFAFDENCSLHFSGSSVEIRFADTGDVLTLPNFLYGYDQGDFKVTFANGVVLKREDLLKGIDDVFTSSASIDFQEMGGTALAEGEGGAIPYYEPVPLPDGTADLSAPRDGDDYLDLTGAAFAYAGAGSDTVLFTNAASLVYGDDPRSNRLFQGNDQLIMVREAGANTPWIYGMGGDDLIMAGTSGSGAVAYGGEGDDTLYGRPQEYDPNVLYRSYLAGGAGDDRIYSGGTAVIDGNAGNDVIVGGAGFDRIEGGDGDDSIEAGAYGDGVYGEAGNDTIYGEGGNDFLDGGQGDNVVHGGGGSDTIWSDTKGADRLYGDGGNDIIHTWQNGAALIDGGDGNDEIYANLSAEFEATVLGGAGDDRIYVNSTGVPQPSQAIRVDGGTGNDLIELYNMRDGACVVNVSADSGDDVLDPSSGTVRIDIAGVAPDAVTMRRDGDGLVIDWGTGSTLTVLRYFPTIKDRSGGAYSGPLDFPIGIQFDDGTLWTRDDFPLVRTEGTDLAEIIPGSFGADEVLAGGGDDLIIGGAGNDVLRGEAGNDDIDGDDGNDRLDGGDGNDFLDGGVGSDTLLGGAGDDQMWASSSSEAEVNTFEGGTGNDEMGGDLYRDVYVFNRGDGQDTIWEWGALDSPAQNALRFGEGIAPGDIYARRDGGDLVVGITGEPDQVTIKEYFIAYTQLGVDAFASRIGEIGFADGTVWLEQGIASLFLANGVSSEMIQYDSDASWNKTAYGTSLDDVLETWGNNDVLYGMGGDDTLRSGAGIDTLDGGTGNDVMEGAAGGDTYVLRRGAGADRIDDLAAPGVNGLAASGGDSDIVRFEDVASTEVRFVTRSGDDLVLDYGAGDRVTVAGYYASTDRMVEEFRFSDAVAWTPADIQARLIATLQGGDGADTLVAPAAASTVLDGQGGDDTLVGSDLTDYLFGGAGNDRLDGGLGADEMAGGLGDDTYVVGDGNDIVLENAGEGTDTVESSLSRVLGAGVENLTLTGTEAIDGTGNEADNVLVGNQQSNVLSGLGGNDVLVAGNGWTDTLVGGDGDDTYVNADQAGQIVEEADGGTDTVLTGASAWYLADNLENAVATGAAQVEGWGNASDNVLTANDAGNTLRGWSGSDTLVGGAGDDYLVGGSAWTGDGDSDLLQGGAGDDVLVGDDGYFFSGSDALNTLEGGAGNDLLVGGSGVDWYVFNQGDGQDVIDESTGSSSMFPGDGDRILLGDGVSVHGASRVGADMVLSLSDDGSDRITIENWYLSILWDHKIEQVVLGDGSTTYSADDLETMAGTQDPWYSSWLSPFESLLGSASGRAGQRKNGHGPLVPGRPSRIGFSGGAMPSPRSQLRAEAAALALHANRLVELMATHGAGDVGHAHPDVFRPQEALAFPTLMP